MARTNPAGERWAAWLNAQLAQRRWRQVDLVNALGDRVARQTVNNWVAGKYAADADTAYIVAATLDAHPADALRAAGYDVVAEALNGLPPSPADAGLDTGPEPADEGIRIILGRKDRTPEQLAEAVDMYRRRKDRLVAEMVRILDAMDGSDERADTA